MQRLAIQANETLLLLDDTQTIPGNKYERAATLRAAIFDLASGREKDRLTQDYAPREWRTVVGNGVQRAVCGHPETGGY